MTRVELVDALEGEIARLKQVLGLLQFSNTEVFALPSGYEHGRSQSKRSLSEEGRLRISEAQKRRWEKYRGASREAAAENHLSS